VSDMIVPMTGSW